MRFDLSIIASWIRQGSTVLDLGCGRGELMLHLAQTKNAVCRGVERDETLTAACINRGLSVLQGDMSEEIRDYPDKSFDVVVLSQTLQQVYNPRELIAEMLRVGRLGVVSFPNFGHWPIRLSLLFGGRAPKSRELPYTWWETPNIRVITLSDFDDFCRDEGFTVRRRAAIATHHRDETGRIVSLAPNLRAAYGIFLLSGDGGHPPKN